MLPANAAVLAVKLTVARVVHPWKALLPILVTFEGIVIEAKELQLWKALPPIDVTEEGMLTEASLEQPLNANASILLPDTIVTWVRLEQLKYDLEAKAAGTLREVGLTPEKA